MEQYLAAVQAWEAAHRERQLARVQICARLDDLAARARSSWNLDEIGEQRQALEQQLLELALQDVADGRKLVRLRHDAPVAAPHTWVEQLALAYDAEPGVWITEGGELRQFWDTPFDSLPAEPATPFDVMIRWSETRQAPKGEARDRYMRACIFSDLPPELAGMLLRSEREHRAYTASHRQARALIDEEYDARGARSDRSLASRVSRRDMRMLVERVVRDGCVLAPAVAAWLHDEQVRESACLLCAQITPRYGTHSCPVRSAQKRRDVGRYELERAIKALCCGTALTDDERRQIDGLDLRTPAGLAQARVLINAVTTRNPPPDVPRFGVTHGALVRMSVRVQVSPAAGEEPVEREVEAQVCDGLAVVEIDGAWQSHHVGSGLQAGRALGERDALVKMMATVRTASLDWTHPEIFLCWGVVEASLARRLLDTNARGRSAVFPVLRDDTECEPLRPGQLLGVGDRFRIDGVARAIVVRLKGEYALCYDHGQMYYLVLRQGSHDLIQEDDGKPLGSESVALRALARAAR